MELEENDTLPFLDVLVKRQPDGTLGFSDYRKSTDTDKYLNDEFHHYPAQNNVLSTPWYNGHTPFVSQNG